MARYGLFKKLFLLTSMMIFIFFIGLLLFQSYFFDHLYLDTKEDQIINFANKIELLNEDKKGIELLKYIDKNLITNNFEMMILNEDKILVKDFLLKKYISIKTKEGIIYNINITNLDDDEFNQLKINKEYMIKAKQYENMDFFLKANKIKENEKIIYNEGIKFFKERLKTNKLLIDKENLNEELDLYSKLNSKDIYLKGKLIYKEDKINLKELDYSYKSLLMDYIKQENITDNDKQQKNLFKDYLFIKKDIKISENNYTIYVISSLEAVDEASSIMSKYYPYMALFALLIAIIMSFLYSKLITKPLLKLNDVAIKMSKLDFSQKSDIKTNDELGSLSNSLNFMSDKLDKTMNELKSANEKLKEDIKREKKLEKLRKEFIANASHDLKTPIGIIKSYAEGIKDGIYKEKKEYYLDVILDEANSMNELVLEMLELSKLESGVIKLDKEEFDLKELVMDYIKKMQIYIDKKNIKLNIDISNKENIVYADYKMIEKVIKNLITNAINYTNKEGYLKIIIKKESNLVFEIENETDISKEEVSRIWDRFYKKDKSRTKENTLSKGSGIGLCIVKNILILHKLNFGAVKTNKGLKIYFEL
ncbi:MAG: cell wall metabolism sensor histidine kinase WalK [Peptostreptococcaceae bacterium]|jgi:signal transduction histidine kinase|nr:cell wall metabolism sensor histidine kinase WalK [Peptostreptococcaceae bacterium]